MREQPINRSRTRARVRWRLVASDEDRATWSRLHSECLPLDDEPPGFHARWIGRVGDRDVAALAGTVLLPAEPAAYLSLVAVCESARGRGVAGSAIRYFGRWAAAEGATHVLTYTHSQNVSSMSAFCRAGYTPYLPVVAWVGRDPCWVYWRRRL